MAPDNTKPNNHQGGRPVNIVVQSKVPLSLVQHNVVAAFAADPPRLSSLPGFGKAEGRAALVAGGPSLRETLDDLRQFNGAIFSCGSNHDYLVENGVIPKYHVVVDPDLCDPSYCRFMMRPHPEITYLLASQANPKFHQYLNEGGHKIYMWHAHLVAEDGTNVVDFRGEPTIPGGDCAILRAWPLAAVLGHRAFDFFGFDCSFPSEDSTGQHAYPYDYGAEEPVIVTTRDGTGRSFISAPGWMSQLNTFVRLLMMSHGQFDVVIHGDGLVADVCCAMNKPQAAA